MPVLASVSPVSSTFSVSLPLSPLIVSRAAIELTLPPVVGALLPTLTVSASAPVLIVVAAEIVCTLTVSEPASPSTVVLPACVLTTVTVSSPSPALTVNDWILA